MRGVLNFRACWNGVIKFYLEFRRHVLSGTIVLLDSPVRLIEVINQITTRKEKIIICKSMQFEFPQAINHEN